MKTIYKYPLRGPSYQDVIELPLGAKVVHFNTQEKYKFFLWAEVDPTEPDTRPRTFYVAGTGQHLGAMCDHVATIKSEGDFMWHLFELRP